MMIDSHYLYPPAPVTSTVQLHRTESAPRGFIETPRYFIAMKWHGEGYRFLWSPGIDDFEG